MTCKVCGRNLELRAGACFDCAEFESLIVDKVDMFDEPVKKEISGTEELNILHQIMKRYGIFEKS